MTYKKEYFYVLKDVWEAWQPVNDPNEFYEATLTPDESGYWITMPVGNNERRVHLKTIPTAFRVERSQLETFQDENETLFAGPDVGDSATPRGTPRHPDTSADDEFKNLYDGSKATLTYNSSGDSTWLIPLSLLENGLDDIDKDGNYIKFPRAAFGPGEIDTSDSSLIVFEDYVLVHVWSIANVKQVSTNAQVTLTIPAP